MDVKAVVSLINAEIKSLKSFNELTECELESRDIRIEILEKLLKKITEKVSE